MPKIELVGGPLDGKCPTALERLRMVRSGNGSYPSVWYENVWRKVSNWDGRLKTIIRAALTAVYVLRQDGKYHFDGYVSTETSASKSSD